MAQEQEPSGFSLTWHPGYLTTYAQFMAPDPWRSVEGESWSVDQFGMNLSVHKPFNLSARPRGRHSNGLAIGVTSSDGRYHMLPVFLADAWVQGSVPDEMLPGILHRIEGPLQLRHYVSAPRMFLRILSAAFMGGGALVALIAGLLFMNGRPDMGWVALQGALLFQVLGPLQWLALRYRERVKAGRVLRWLPAAPQRVSSS